MLLRKSSEVSKETARTQLGINPLEVLEAYSSASTALPALTLEDYTDAGIIDITARKVAVTNTKMRATIVSGQNNIQALVTTAADNDDPGTIKISGTAAQNQILTAGSVTDPDDGVENTTFQWQADGTNITGATNSTYTLTQADVGKTITVVATYDDSKGSGKIITSAATSAVAKVNDSVLSGNISPASNLTMTFAEDVVKGTGNITILNSTDTSAPSVVIDVTSSQVSIDAAKKIITINPTDDLTAGDSYYVQIDTGAFRDSTDNSYAGISDTSSWAFTVAALTTDAVWSNGSTAVSTKGINATELSSLSITGTLSNQNDTTTGVTIESIVFKAASGSAGDVSYSGTMPTVSDTNGSTWTLASTAVPALVNGESYTIKVGLSADGGITGTGGNTNSVTIDTTLPTIAITSDESSLKGGETATITFTLSEASTDFAVEDVTVAGGALSNFALKPDETKIYTATFTPNVSSTTAGEISVASSKFSDAAGNNNADGADTNNNVSLTVDTAAPTVSSATITATDASDVAKTSTLIAGDKVVVTVKMSEATTITGTPTYTIDVGGVSKSASYTSGSGSDTLVFSYTVGAGDEDTVGGITAGTAALTLAGSSTLKDAAGNNATLTTPAAATNTLAVDTAVPTVSSATITATDASDVAKTSTLIAGDKVVVTVKMSEATTITGTPTYTIDVGGVSKSASYTSGSGSDTLVFSYTVASGDEDSAGGITAGTAALTLAGSSTLKDAAGNNATLTTPAAATNTLAVDTAVPTVSSATITATDASDVAKTSTLIAGDKVVVTVKMSESTTVTGTPTYTIDVGGVSKSASYTSGSGSDTLVFSYTVASGDEDSAGGITAGTAALTLAGSSTLKDAAGNNATLTTPACCD